MSERRTVDGLTLSSIALQFSGMREERSVVHFVEEWCCMQEGVGKYFYLGTYLPLQGCI